MTGTVEEVIQRGWWVGANDEENEGHWVWVGGDSYQKSVNDSSWFRFGRGNPVKPEFKYNHFWEMT